MPPGVALLSGANNARRAVWLGVGGSMALRANELRLRSAPSPLFVCSQPARRQQRDGRKEWHVFIVGLQVNMEAQQPSPLALAPRFR